MLRQRHHNPPEHVGPTPLTCCSFLHIMQLVVEEGDLCVFLLHHVGDVV